MTSLFSGLRPTFVIQDTADWKFGWLMYFHLEGGVDEERNDQFLWTAFYDCPADRHVEKRGNMAAVPYCKAHDYPYGTGDTPEEAIKGLKTILREWVESRSLPQS